MSANKTAIVTGAQQGIGAGLVEGFLQAGYNVVGLRLLQLPRPSARSRLVLVDGDTSKRGTAEKTVEAGVKHFGAVDLLVNNAGIFYAKLFTEFTADDFNALASSNLLGFPQITQLAVKQMLRQKIRERCDHHGSTCRQPDRRCERLGLHDYEGRAEYGHPATRR